MTTTQSPTAAADLGRLIDLLDVMIETAEAYPAGDRLLAARLIPIGNADCSSLTMTTADERGLLGEVAAGLIESTPGQRPAASP